jgi:hypothetical protein
MTYEAFVDIFKAAVATYNATPPLETLTFHYDYVWYNDGAAANAYPSMLFECSPDFELDGLQNNGNAGLQTFSGKLFFYDTYEESEQAGDLVGTHTVESWRKQSRLNDIAIILTGNINLAMQNANARSITWGKGFLAKDVHNPKLIQVMLGFKATLKVDCKI